MTIWNPIRKQEIKTIENKDKITYLNAIYEEIISASDRQCEEHRKMVSLSVEAYLYCFDNDDRGVYSVAEECFNKNTHALLFTNVILLNWCKF